MNQDHRDNRKPDEDDQYDPREARRIFFLFGGTVLVCLCWIAWFMYVRMTA